jgi:hypothetical protein
MTRYAITILSSFAILIFSLSCSQKRTEYVLSDIGLKLEIPSSFKVLTAAQNDALNKKGLKLVEDANHISLDASQTKTLISAKKNESNYITVTMTPYNVSQDGPYMESVKQVNNLIYNTFHSKIPDAKIDTSTSKKNIGDREFKEFHLAIPIKGQVTMNVIMFSKYYQGFDLTISYVYVDDVSKNQMEDILQSCKFVY